MMKRRVYLIPNAITAFALSCGLFVIFKTNMVEPGEGDFQILQTSVVLLLVAAFADVMDGAVARVIHAESEFGEIFDSLSDAVAFGVAPSVLLLKNLSLGQGSGLSFFAILGVMLFSICGVLRLVRFNVSGSLAKGDKNEELARKKNFTGLPIPAAAIAAVSANLFFVSPYGASLHWSHELVSAILISAMIVLGFFMVSRWKFPSLKALHFRVPSFQLIVMTVLLAMTVLYGMIHFFPIMLLILSWGYLLVGWILSLIRLIAGKKSKTLEDFEPEEEEDSD